MMFRVGLVTGFAAGYVLGSRAGRERYEQITRNLRGVRERPAVQEAAGVVSAQAGGFAGKAKDFVASHRPGSKGSDPATSSTYATSNGHPYN